MNETLDPTVGEKIDAINDAARQKVEAVVDKARSVVGHVA